MEESFKLALIDSLKLNRIGFDRICEEKLGYTEIAGRINIFIRNIAKCFAIMHEELPFNTISMLKVLKMQFVGNVSIQEELSFILRGFPYTIMPELSEEIRNIINPIYPIPSDLQLEVNQEINVAIDYLAQVVLFIIEDVISTCHEDKIGAMIVSREFKEWSFTNCNNFN